MSDPSPSLGRALDPIDRILEVLFGLIMVLGFTTSLEAAGAVRDDVHAMLLGALGCNLAWGIIDGVMYLMARLGEKGRGLVMFRAARAAVEPADADGLITEALPPVIASLMRPEEIAGLSRRLKEMPEPPNHVRLNREDWLGGLGVFLLVFLSTFPVVIPFLVMTHVEPAMRVSNAVAIVMLFITGFAYGRYAGRRPFRVGISMVLLGIALAALSSALGG